MKRQTKSAGLPDSWEALVDRLDLLAGTVSSTAAAVGKKDGELTVMRRELETRIGNLETHVTAALHELRSKEAAPPTRREETVASGSRERVDTRVVLLTEDIAALSAQLHAMATTVQTTSAGIASHERKLEVLGKRLETPGESGGKELGDSFEQRLDDLVRATAGAAQALAAQEAEIATVRTAFATSNDVLEQRFEELQQTTAELVVRAEPPPNVTTRDTTLDDALEQRVQDVVQAITSASARLDSQQAEIATISTTLAAPSDAVELRVEELSQMVAGLAVRVDDLARLGEAVAHDTNLDDVLEQRLDDVVQAITSAAERLDTQQVEIATISTTLATPSDALDLRVEELRQMVTALVGRVEDLTPLTEAMAGGTNLGEALERRLDDVVQSMTSAAEHLGAQEAEISTLRTALATSNRAIEQRVDQLGQTVAELVVRGDDLARIEEAIVRGTELDDALEQRHDDVVQALTRASERLDAQQLEIATMMTTLSAPTNALELRVEELSQMVAAIAVELHRLDQQRDESLATSNLDARISEMSGAIDEMGAVIDGVVSRVDKMVAGFDDSLAALRDPEVGLAGLDRHFTEASNRFETIIGDLRGLIRILPTPTEDENEELVSQLDALRASAAASAERIEHLESQTPAGAANPAAVEHLEHELAALHERLQRSAMPEEIVSQLDALRLSSATVATHIERLEDLTSRTAENASSSASRIGADLAALAKRIERVERREGGLMAEIERAQALWPVALRSLEARLDDIAAGQIDVAPGAEENGASVLAGLRASLETMETAIAADMARTTNGPGPASADHNGG